MEACKSTSASTVSCAMILRVVEADRARKVKLSARPASVSALIQILKDQLQLDLEFTLQYEDPDFNNQLTSLDDINELPQKAVVHILPVESDCSTTSTEILSDMSNSERAKMWPRGDFPIPQFSYDVELRLRQGNDEFEKSGKGLKLTRDQKHDILERLGSTIYDFKAYPDDKQLGKVAEALVTKHPCLKEPGSDNGWNGWKTSIKFKMGNLRNKMRKIGCREVAVNAGKRSQGHPENEPSHSKIKKPRRSEVNYLPNFPQGEDEASLEIVRQEIAVEVQKTEKNTTLIHKNMEKTFALRRQNIVTGSPSVKEFLNLWPALCITSELFAEYQRVTNENLPQKFYAQLDHHLPRLMTILRQKASKTGKTADNLANILKVHDEQELHDVTSRRTTVIRGLPVLLRDSVLGFFKTTLIDNPEILTEDDPVALLTVVHENADAPIHYDPVRVSVVLENEVVTTHSQLPEAFLVLFGFMYALHIKYPKGLAKTFEFVQKVLLGMDDGKLSPSLQTLKNDLM